MTIKGDGDDEDHDGTDTINVSKCTSQMIVHLGCLCFVYHNISIMLTFHIYHKLLDDSIIHSTIFLMATPPTLVFCILSKGNPSLSNRSRHKYTVRKYSKNVHISICDHYTTRSPTKSVKRGPISMQYVFIKLIDGLSQ